MLDLGEAFNGGATHTLGRGVRRDQLGMRGFQSLQIAQQRIELLVGDLGLGIEIVQAVVVVDLATQGLDALFGKHGVR